MKITTFVAVLLLSFQCFAENLQSTLRSIEKEWESIYYSMPKGERSNAYALLLRKTDELSRHFPISAELLFWQAIIKATDADHLDAISALDSIHSARDLLFEAIKINPNVMKGSAYVTLGTLYYKVPKWPIAFGDNSKAKEFLETALKINPDGIDSNYYYADFLLSMNELEKAEFYFNKAANAPKQATQSYSDLRLKQEARIAIMKTKNRKIGHVKGNLSFF